MRYLLSFCFLLASCTSVYHQPDGHVIVPRAVEVRSPFGTNMGFVMLERCQEKQVPSRWSAPFASSTEYVKCEPITNWYAEASQGQGGQIAAGAMIGLGFGLGSAFAPSNSTSAFSSSSSSAATAPAKHGH